MGFRPCHGRLDQLYSLARVLKGAQEFTQPVYVCFVDLEKAYDHAPQGVLCGVLWEYGVGGLLFWVIRSIWTRAGLHCQQ